MLDLVHLAQHGEPDAAQARREAIEMLHRATAIYTAEPVVERLLARVDWPADGRTLVDPSCGDGAFLVAAIRRATSIGRLSDEALCAALSGWEVHPEACSLARARVAQALVAAGRPTVQALRLAVHIVRQGDFLTDGPSVPTYDIIAGNPPYLRWVNIPAVLRGDYARHVPTYALHDMLYSFLDRCAHTLRPGGDILFVTSDRWLFNSGAARLRDALGRTVNLSHVERLEASSTFYRPKLRRAGTPPRIHPVAVHLRRGDGTALTREAMYPGVERGQYEEYERLGDLATVRLAPWLGSPGIFVIDTATATASRIPLQHLVPAIDTDDIDLDTLRPPVRFAIVTRPDVEPCAEIKAHLAASMHQMAARGRKGRPWMPPESFHRMNLQVPSLLVPRIAKSPRAIPIPAGHLPINHNLSIVTAQEETLSRIRWALSRPLAQRWVQEHAAPLENGYFSLTTTLLRKMPIEPM